MHHLYLTVPATSMGPAFTTTFSYQERAGSTPRQQALVEYNLFRFRQTGLPDLVSLPVGSTVEFNDE